MDLNRNHYFLAGLLMLFIGCQFRQIESFTLNNRATQFIEARMASAQATMNEFKDVNLQPPKKRFDPQVKPPRWIGLALLSLGSVICMYSFVMPKP